MGRVLRTPEQRWRLIGQYQASGLGKAEFCRREGIKLGTFCQWVNGQRGGGQKPFATSMKSKVQFAEVQMAMGGAAPLEIVLGSGHCLRVRDLSRLKEVAELIREVSAC